MVGSVCAVLVEVKLIVVCSMVGYSSLKNPSPTLNVCLFSFHFQKMLRVVLGEQLWEEDKLLQGSFPARRTSFAGLLGFPVPMGADDTCGSLNLGSKFGKWKSRAV